MGWVNIGILSGLAATAIPVVIHLLRNRRYEQADLGTLRFLQQALRETAKWRKLQNLLLFLCRLLIIILLTLLFARPFLTNPGGGDADVEVLLLADVSRSTEGRTVGGTVEGFIRSEAEKIRKNLPESTKLTLGVFADDVRVVDALDNRTCRPRGRTDYARALSWARDRISASTARHQEIVLVTDMQAAGLPSSSLSEWPASLSVRVIPVPVPTSPNMAVQGVECLTPFTIGDALLRVDIQVTGETDRSTIDTVLEIGDDMAIRETFPCRTGSHRIRIPAPADGLVSGGLSITGDDDYPTDNARTLSFHIQRPVRVLLLDGDPDSMSAEPETYYLETALRLARFPDGSSAFLPETARELPDLAGYDVIALCNPGDVGSAGAKLLREAVSRGKGLVVFLGDQTDSGACGRLTRAGLLPGSVKPNQIPMPLPLGNWDSRHPALVAFRSRETGNLTRLVFRDAFAVKPHAPTDVLATLINGAPAILAARLEEGRIVTVTNPCDKEWTSWSTERIFVPLTRELFAYVAGLNEDRDVSAVRTETIDEELDVGRHPGTPPVVIVPDAAEMDMTRCDEATFRSRLGIGSKPGRPAWSEEGLPTGRERAREFWHWLALAVLVLMVCETILADRGKVA